MRKGVTITRSLSWPRVSSASWSEERGGGGADNQSACQGPEKEGTDLFQSGESYPLKLKGGSRNSCSPSLVEKKKGRESFISLSGKGGKKVSRISETAYRASPTS